MNDQAFQVEEGTQETIASKCHPPDFLKYI